MKFLEVLGKIGVTLIGVAAVVALVWLTCYAVVPTIRDGTDKLFKWGDYKEVVEDDETTDKDIITDSTNTNAQFVFENDFISITVG